MRFEVVVNPAEGNQNTLDEFANSIAVSITNVIGPALDLSTLTVKPMGQSSRELDRLPTVGVVYRSRNNEGVHSMDKFRRAMAVSVTYGALLSAVLGIVIAAVSVAVFL